MTTTTNMGLTQSTVGTTTGPDWATNAENNLLTIDAHDHTSGKGVQLTPSSLNINADLEFNLNSATELKNVVLDNAVHASASGDTNNSVYEYDGNLYWRNASGGSVQITSGTAVNTSGGSISGMTGNAQVLFSSNSYAFKFDSSLSDPGIAKISHADIDLYKYDASGSAAKVTLKFLGTGTSAALTVPDETGTLLTTATSFAGTINLATSSSNAPINLKPNGTGHVAVGNGGASGKLTSNGAFDLVLDTNSGTNSGSITITDGTNGNIAITPNGTGEVDISKVDIDGGAIDGVTIGLNSVVTELYVDNLKFDGNTISSTNTNGQIYLAPNGTGEVNISKVDIVSGKIDGVTIGTNSVATDIRVDNLKLDGNTISSTNTDGDIDISPNGTGSIDLNSGTLDLSAQTVDVTLNAAVDALNFDSNTLSIDASNNRVGIGTAAPTDTLTVSGDGIFTSTTGAGITVIDSDDKANGWQLRANGTRFQIGEVGVADRFAILAGGNVGIGTVSPSALLHVNGSRATAGDPLTIIKATDNDHTGIGLMAYGSNASHRNWLVAANLDVAGSFGIGYTANDSDVPTTANVTNALSIDSSGNVGIGTDSPTQKLTVNGNIDMTNIMRIGGNNSSLYFQALGSGTGYVGIGTTDPDNLFHTVKGASSANTPSVIFQNLEGNTGASDELVRITYGDNDVHSDAFYLRFRDGNGFTGGVTSGGSGSVNYDTSSDYRLKENVTNLTNGLERVLQLRPKRFNFIGNKAKTKQDGFIAHEVFDASEDNSYLVTGQKDAVFDNNGVEEINPQSLDYGRFTPMLVAAIQELAAKVTALENATY